MLIFTSRKTLSRQTLLARSLHTFHIPPQTAVYPFGDINSKKPLFSHFGWTIKEDERWAVVGGGPGRKSLIEVYLSLPHTVYTIS